MRVVDRRPGDGIEPCRRPTRPDPSDRAGGAIRPKPDIGPVGRPEGQSRCAGPAARVGAGPPTLGDTCVVRVSAPRRRLHLTARAGPSAAARTAMTSAPEEEVRATALDVAQSLSGKAGSTLGTIKSRLYTEVLATLRDTTNPLG